MVTQNSYICRLLISFLCVTAYVSATDVNGPTTITTEGVYVVADSIVTPGIRISANNVEVDLNGYQVFGVLIDSGMDAVTVRNGIVQGASPALQAQGSTHIILEDLHTYGALDHGISFTNVIGGIVRNCFCANNGDAGIRLYNSHKINFENTIAECNANFGFSLVSSTTNSFQDCKALSIGENNQEVLNQTIVGFDSVDGYGNIFERCIANATQALSTTDYNSFVAGFALRGSESCTKIIECESANAQTNANGRTVPYGILLEGSLDNLLESATQTGATILANVIFAQWSPNGKYIAACDEDLGLLIIYEYNRVSGRLEEIAKQSNLSVPTQLSWSCDGNYVLVSDSDLDKIIIYAFDSREKTLTEVTSQLGNTTLQAPGFSAWSPNEEYVVTVDGVIDAVLVYKFDRVLATLSELVMSAISNPRYVDWSPDGVHIVVAQSSNFVIYRFDVATESLIEVNQGLNDLSNITSVEWSPNGSYIVVTDSNDNNVVIYQFNVDDSSLARIVTQSGTTNLSFPRSAEWSSNGEYIIIADSIAQVIVAYRFDPGVPSLTEVITQSGTTNLVSPQAVSWSDDGSYIVVADSGINKMIVYSALSFPAKNVIKNNTIYCNSGGNGPLGVGISGSSIANMIIGNIAYSNPMYQEINHPLVASNYQFVTNVFSQLFGDVPSDLQNISINPMQPVCQPDDLALLLKQILFKANTFSSILDDLAANLNSMCSPQAGINTKTTINEPGLYCLQQDVSATGPVITIDSDDVAINLNQHTITLSGGSGIVVNGKKNIAIFDGVLKEANNGHTQIGINIAAGSSHIILDSVSVLGASEGLSFASGCSQAKIRNCSFENNLTGLQITESNNICVENSIARANNLFGFSLISSVTCCFNECKALSTGDGNTASSDTTAVGFSSVGGYGNIFENCIANGSQALAAIDSASVVTGFYLGSQNGIQEQCSKIINCEAANAQTSEQGYAVPYGILLESAVNNPITFTTVNNITLDEFEDADWRFDGKYLVAANEENNYVAVYEVDRSTDAVQELVRVSVIDPVVSQWSPNGLYISVADNNNPEMLRIYKFDDVNYTLDEVASISANGNEPYTAEWSPCGNYIAVGNGSSTLTIFTFDCVNEALSQLINVSENGLVTTAKWSPDGNYLGVVDFVGSGLLIYAFNAAVPSMIPVANQANATFISGDWSPDGIYFAVADAASEVFVYKFANNSLMSVAESIALSAPEGVAWSGDGNYLAVISSLLDALIIFEFDPVNNQLTEVGRLETSLIFNAGNAVSISWSPDGRYISFCDQSSGGGISLIVADVLNFPSKNVITKNTVYCNSGGICSSGIGISGSSIENLIIGNIAYSNPTNPLYGVSTNYSFVTNVFNQLFGQAPSDLQNISLNGNQPISVPVDLATLEKQIQLKVCGINSALEQLSENLSGIDAACAPITITQMTTITQSGVYCLANDLSTTTTAIKIQADNVDLDLNNHTITFDSGYGIEIDGKHNITIYNGTIKGPNILNSIGISMNGVWEVALNAISIFDAGYGILSNESFDCKVTNCIFSHNIISGFVLDTCNNMEVENCIAQNNGALGFSMAFSDTCCFRDCKAMDTGFENELSLDAWGFSSSRGVGNIFERCISQGSTSQATAFSRFAAGFILDRERCDKIIDCEASGANTNANGESLAYGIYLHSNFDELGEVASSLSSESVYAVDWSPDGKLLAAGINSSDTGNDLYLYAFNYQDQTLTQLDSVSPGSGATDNQVSVLAWNPDNLYLAVGGDLNSNTGGANLVLYYYDSINQRLISKQYVSVSFANVTGLSWSSDGRYLAVVGDTNNIDIYEFNPITETLSLYLSKDIGDTVMAVDWAPNSDFIAVTIGDMAPISLQIYQRITNDLTLIQLQSLGTFSSAASVKWAFDGKFLAIGGLDVSNDSVLAYKFDQDYNLTAQGSVQPIAPTNGFKVDWSCDGRYLLVLDSDNLYVYSYDRDSTFSDEANISLSGSLSGLWSPDAQYIAAGGSNGLTVQQGLTYPEKCVITNNTVYCNGSSGTTGIGISGSSIANMIIGNTAYSNPSNPFITGTNYVAVTNVFNQNFGQAPTDLQNISLDCNQPICTPEDPILLLKQIQYAVTACAPTPIFASNIPTTISESGVYCLADDVTTSAIVPIRITGDNVTVDLNGHTLEDTTGINIVMYIDGADNATIKNGRIILPGSTAILVSGENALITDMQIINQSAIDIDIDISITSVSSGCIKNCILFGGDVGINAVGVSNLLIENVIVNEASQIGISLNNSCSFCCIRDCKILSTGNASSSNIISGISLNGGFGNIVENCIVNGTQGNSVTAYDSLVAGISLLSTESCSKIIDCEVANTTVSESGYAVPYGILLEAQFDNLVAVTSIDPGGSGAGDTVYSASWSPDGKYLAIAGRVYGGTNDDLWIYEFDRGAGSLIPVVSINPGGGSTSDILLSVDWSPDGKYLAVGGIINGDTSDDLWIYEFDPAGSLIPVVSINPDEGSDDEIESVDWSPDGKYLAVGGDINGATGDDLWIYEFDRGAGSLIPVVSIDPDGGSNGVASVDWSPNGKYLAVGGAINGVTDDDLWIYEFDRGAGSLIPVVSINPDEGSDDAINAVNWSPDGKYLAVGGIINGDTSDDLWIYEFDPAGSLIPVVSINPDEGSDDGIFTLDWSPDGKYLAVGGIIYGDTSDDLWIYEFDPAGSLNFIASTTPGAGSVIQSVIWSPDGTYLAIGGTIMNHDLWMYETLTFPSKNVIKNNTVYCNSVGGDNPRGVGISGSSIANMIIGNTSYANPVDPFMVAQNYVFVTNEFNQLFGIGPSDLQNIGLAYNQPICQPTDLCLLLKQNQFGLQSANDLLDLLLAPL